MTVSRSNGSRGVDGDQEFPADDAPRRGEISTEPPPEALRWIAGHCRFVATNLPRGVLGVNFATQLLDAVPDACRRRVPDLTGTGPELLARCVDYGLLTEVPSARVVRATLQLVAAHSPILQARGKRQWTLWLVHLLDPAMLAKIQKRTPASQLEVCPPAPRSRPRARGELAAENRALADALAAERSASAEFRARAEALSTALDDKSAALDKVLREAADLAERSAALSAEVTRLRGCEAELGQLQIRLREALNQVEPLRHRVGVQEEENARLQEELDQAAERIKRLGDRVERNELAGELGAAVFNLGKTLWRGRGGKPEGGS